MSPLGVKSYYRTVGGGGGGYQVVSALSTATFVAAGIGFSAPALKSQHSRPSRRKWMWLFLCMLLWQSGKHLDGSRSVVCNMVCFGPDTWHTSTWERRKAFHYNKTLGWWQALKRKKGSDSWRFNEQKNVYFYLCYLLISVSSCCKQFFRFFSILFSIY